MNDMHWFESDPSSRVYKGWVECERICCERGWYVERGWRTQWVGASENTRMQDGVEHDGGPGESSTGACELTVRVSEQYMSSCEV